MSDEMDYVINMLEYFWHEKGDIKRWVDYKENKHLFPSVLEAVKQFEKAKSDVGAAIAELREQNL